MSAPKPTQESEDRDTGLPALRSWRAVYIAVAAVVLVWLALLAVLTRRYS